MSYEIEFPALYALTKMQADLINAISKNLKDYSPEVQIDYADYTAFIIEYSDWSERSEAASQAAS